MNATDQDLLKRRLLYILHLGLVELRNLALADGNERIADLSDALEILPPLVEKDCTEEDLELIRYVLKNYQDKHRSNFDYPARFNQYDPQGNRI